MDAGTPSLSTGVDLLQVTHKCVVIHLDEPTGVSLQVVVEVSVRRSLRGEPISA